MLFPPHSLILGGARLHLPEKGNPPCHLFWLDSLSVFIKRHWIPLVQRTWAYQQYRGWRGSIIISKNMDITYCRGDLPHYRTAVLPPNQKSNRDCTCISIEGRALFIFFLTLEATHIGCMLNKKKRFHHVRIGKIWQNVYEDAVYFAL
jgi:hypothetical protein